jgi:hypothetical protein
MPAKILTGICCVAACSFAQTYTVSAKPGAVNYIQGDVTINGDAVWTSNLKTTFLKANDTIAVNNGRAEVLLTPGVFMRLGANSQVRMIQPSLIETQLEVLSGESMIEVDDMVPGSSIAVMDHGSSTTLLKPGLFRFTEHSIAALDGKADVAFGDRKVVLTKNKEVAIDDTLHASKVDLTQPDDLYAWSNVRAQYNAAASYAGSMQAYNAGGYGFSSYSAPGWYWGTQYNSWMWMPFNGAFYSPFGWGFYGPGVVAYAPVMLFPSYSGGYLYGGYNPVMVGGTPITLPIKPPTGVTPPVRVVRTEMVVPVNPNHVGVANFQGSSPASLTAARIQMQNYADFYGLHTASGRPAANLRGGQTFSSMQAASHAAIASSRSSSSGGSSGGGMHANSSSSGYAASSSGWSGGAASSGGSIGSSSMARSGGGGSGGGGGHGVK